MKRWPILTVALEREVDVVGARRMARRIADLLGFSPQDQTRIATATSEIARNAQSYAQGGRVGFALNGRKSPEALEITVSDKGSGIPDLEAVLEGQFTSDQGLGVGISGARRLMDAFTVQNGPQGAAVVMTKALPRRGSFRPEALADISLALAQQAATDPMEELRAQNQELMLSLEALERRRLEASALSEELERTNKGVVALYAELDRRASELEELNTTLERRIAEGLAERAKVEESLRQSQKMEAVGQLTGGIAHDFNNLLMVIGGSLELLRRRLPPDPAILKLLDAAHHGVERGGALNQQLLAFARRQDLREETIVVDAFIASCALLIERALSEDIAIQVETQSENWCCRTDPHQLETAILNLAINGRDAMPSGGRLTLAALRRTVSAAEAAAAEVAPGDYVVIRVGDTGAGMTPDVLERAFEPFFTTKSVGRGTGLGLSQVYGFAKQSGGFVAIHTAPERGTEVDIHLPRSDPAPVAADHKPPAPPERRGDASILVVEDDAGVRAVACQMLRDLGYAVTEAHNGRRALEAIEERPFDLVFSDVILPDGLSGLDLAHEVQRRASATPVLLTSGYTGQRLSPIDESPFRILRKPYGEAQLSEAVRAALASRGRSGPDPSASDRQG